MLISDQCFPIFIPGTYLCRTYDTTMQKMHVKHKYLVKYYQSCDLFPKSTMWIVTKGCITVQILQFFTLFKNTFLRLFPHTYPAQTVRVTGTYISLLYSQCEKSCKSRSPYVPLQGWPGHNTNYSLCSNHTWVFCIRVSLHWTIY